MKKLIVILLMPCIWWGLFKEMFNKFIIMTGGEIGAIIGMISFTIMYVSFVKFILELEFFKN